MGKLVCPHCSTATSFSPVLLRGQGILLSDSNPQWKAYKLVDFPAVTDENYVEIKDNLYAILECQGCYKWFVAKREKYGSNEWSAVYPIPHKAVAKEIPQPIKRQFEEACLCLAIGAYTGCLLMCRTAFISLQRKEDVPNLQTLKDKGSISSMLYQQANEVRLWANMAGHDDIPENVCREDAEQLLFYTEALLNAIYVEPKLLENLTQKRKQIKDKT
jgi:hypothetical protein